ncbi:MAG: hypothetical protein ABL918_00805 [Chakrabartia sp.]
MTMKPPPSRYKVIEKGGRLITIDTQAGPDTTILAPPHVIESSKKTAAPARPSALQSPKALGALPKPGLLLGIATMFVEKDRDAAGNMLFRTHKYYDPDAPRLLRLTEKQAVGLGGIGLTFFVLLGIITLLFATGAWFFMIPFVFIAVKMAGKPFKTMMTKLLKDAVVVDQSANG